MTTEVILYPEALEFRSAVTIDGDDKLANYLSMWSDGANGFVLSKKAATTDPADTSGPKTTTFAHKSAF